MKEREEWLIVDGYNVIGANEGWSSLPLEEARKRLVAILSEYQAVFSRRVLLVFDAHRVPGAGARHSEEGIAIMYTKERETADQLIESLVKKHRRPGRRIYVATSDYMEQTVVFGQGAYRISSRELLEEFRRMKGEIARAIEKWKTGKPTLGQELREDVLKKLEIWRRKK